MAYKDPEPMSQEDFEREAQALDLAKDRSSRTKAALGMKIAGANYTEIAEHLGYADASRARQAVEMALGSTVDDDSREKARQLANLKYDRVLRSIWEKVISPTVKNPITEDEEINHEQLAAARTAITLIEKQARLNGAERPQEVVVYTPLQHEMQQELKTMLQKMHGDMPQEVDVIQSSVTGERHDPPA